MPTMAQIQPYLPLIIMALNGLVAGWLAGQILGGGGLIRNVVVGLIGAFVGGILIQQGWLKLPFTTGSIYGDQIIVSTLGAMLVILISRFLGRST